MLLIRHLPPDSATKRKLNPDGALIESWGPGEYIAADTFDLLARVSYKNPKPYPRPAQTVAERAATDRRHAALIARHEQRLKQLERSETEGGDE